VSSVDSAFATNYIYGQDGERSNKYTEKSETLYFNKMWTLHTDSGNATHGGQTAKNIYLGDTRIVTKLNSGSGATFSEENAKQYFYHSDYLGSASLISDKDGNEYQRIEYTPYGETWVEKTQNTGLEWLPYKFTAKEMDEETGLYYYGARYLDPKYSRWLSTDPAMSDYMAGSDAGGGAYNATNFSLYNYGNNNPVKYTDPDGRITQHKDLKGSDRAKAELKDIVQCSLKYGLFASISATVWEVLNIGAEVDAGSVEVSGSLNDDVKTTESAGIGIELGVLDFLKGKLSVEKSRELPDGEEFDDFTQVLKDIYTKGEVSPDIEASIGPLSTSAADEDVKVGVEAGLGVGIGMWINLSEIKDFFKGWINGDY
ncbi:MAG: RHS repeat-associated core domain-containing protein, partial [Treponema sp.]|nr:RHS repeat-associated core domain-containing protein [Treponema sp.]